MLFEFLKSHMLNNPKKLLSDSNKNITYVEFIEYAEIFGKELNYPKYGILCKFELNAAKNLLACFAAKKTAVMLSYKYGNIHNQKIVESIGLSHIITDEGIEEVSRQVEEIENLDDVALIMCTSGTTGTPKCAMITEENLFTNINDILDYFEITANDAILITRPLYHCAVLTGEFLVSLVRGLNIVFHNDNFNPIRTIKTAMQKGISVFCGTPTIFFHLSEFCAKTENVLTINAIAVSGECMTDIVAKRIENVFKNTKIYNVYGLTEVSPRVSYLPYELFHKFPLSVGKPLKSLVVTCQHFLNRLHLTGQV